jgi:hypothetical protein
MTDPGFLVLAGTRGLPVSRPLPPLYRLADRASRLLRPTGTRTAARRVAFLLLCIGVQILIAGAQNLLGPLPAGRGAN